MGFRDSVPASLQTIIQNGLLDTVFEEPLLAQYIYDRIADVIPWGGAMGTESIMTRSGLLPVQTSPVTGLDANVGAYGFEQYRVKMDQYGYSIDTNMAMSAFALASKFLEDNKILGINAAESLNLVSQAALYGAYGNGTTHIDVGATSVTQVVADASGFQFAPQADATTNSNPGEGLTGVNVPTLQPVSSSNPLAITVNGVANTVTGCNVSTNTLTLGTSITTVNGQAVVSSIGAVSYRPNARASSDDLVAGDIATLALFQSAVTRLRTQNVPTVGGAYTAHVHPNTVEELFQDSAFRQVYQGRADSSAYRNLTVGESAGDSIEFMGRFSGIDWFMNTVTPVGVNGTGVQFFRPIVVGQGALIKAPFDRMADLISEINAGTTVQIDFVNGVARILRAPLDRFGQVLSSTWSWIGGYTVGTDLLTGDAAAYKRGVVLEHA